MRPPSRRRAARRSASPRSTCWLRRWMSTATTSARCCARTAPTARRCSTASTRWLPERLTRARTAARLACAAVARILILGGGCRGRRLAGELLAGGHAVRITTRAESGRAAIEALGAECWVGTPDRLATLRGSLENVAIACWLLGTASGEPEDLAALYTTRL